MRVLAALTLLVLFATPAAAKTPPAPAQTAVVRTGPAPCGIAAHGGSLWVGVYTAGLLLMLDDRTGQVEGRTRIGPAACRVAVGSRAVWITRDRAGELVRVSRGSGNRHRVAVGAGAFDVELASGSVWATSFDAGTVARVNPRRADVERSYAVGPKPAGITACGGSIWVGHGGSATWLTAIDPRSGRTRRVDVVVEAPGWPRCIRGELWVTTASGVVRVDPGTDELLSHYELGGSPVAAALGPDGLVWITDKQRSVVHRIDPLRGVIDAFAAGHGAYELVRVGRTMWVTSFAGADIRRFGP